LKGGNDQVDKEEWTEMGNQIINDEKGEEKEK
jgi:hypothetical protein